MDFCSANRLSITNTKFKQHPRRLYTWTSPDQVTRNQIDYLICQQRWESSVKNAKTLPGADCASDHNLLMMKVKIKMKRIAKPPLTRKFDLEKIQTCNDFSLELKNRFQGLEIDDNSSEEFWSQVKSTVLSVAEEKLPKLDKKKISPWLSTEAIEVAKRRREARIKRREADVRRLNSEFQRQARRDKENFLQERCKKIEENSRLGRTRDLYKDVKELTGTFRPKTGVINNSAGQTVTEAEEIKKQWEEYTKELYRRDPDMPDTFLPHEYDDEPNILESEVRSAMKALPNHKSAGLDNIPIEFFKPPNEEIVRVFTILCNKIWSSKCWPEDWKTSIYIPIFKKGDRKECANYRTIALISHASKIMLKILQQRIESYICPELPDEQAGFRKERGTRDHISNIRRIVKKPTQCGNHCCFASLITRKRLTVWTIKVFGEYWK